MFLSSIHETLVSILNTVQKAITKPQTDHHLSFNFLSLFKKCGHLHNENHTLAHTVYGQGCS